MASLVLPSSSALPTHQPSILGPHPQPKTPRVSFLREVQPRVARFAVCLGRIPSPRIAHVPLANPSSNDGNNNNNNNNNSGGDGGDDGGDGGASDDHRGEALIVLAHVGRKLQSPPYDFKVAVEDSRVAWELRWLPQFGERLLANDLFLAKLAMECGVGVVAKTAAEYEKRKENFVKEIDIVFSHVVKGIVADSMLGYLSAPIVSLQPSPGTIGAIISQTALGARSYLFVHRLGKIVAIVPRPFAVGTSASLVGTGVTDALVLARKPVVNQLDDKVKETPVASTPEKVEDKEWWSYFQFKAEVSAGLIPTDASIRAGRLQPAAMARASAFSSSSSSGRSSKNGIA